MKDLKQHLSCLVADERGATALEYGLMAALIAAVIVGTVRILGGNLNTVFSNINAALTGTGGPPATQ